MSIDHSKLERKEDHEDRNSEKGGREKERKKEGKKERKIVKDSHRQRKTSTYEQ